MGTLVEVERRNGSASARVIKSEPGRCRVRFDDGREAWVDVAMVRVLEAAPPNPYAAPAAALDGDRATAPVTPELANIARYQRWVNLAVLLYFGAIFAAMIGTVAPLLGRILGMATYVGALCLGIYATARLAAAVYGVVVAVVICVLNCVPLVGLLTLLILNREATKRLRAAGISVGLLGADPRQFA